MPSPVKRLLDSRAIRERYGDRSTRTLRRWELSGVLPPPDRIINKRKYWWHETLERHERELIAEKAAASSAL